jgi:predicted Ser/Thr protein kinase/intein/homing endonuclease
MKGSPKMMIDNSLDFRQVIFDQREKRESKEWSGTMIEYLYKVKETPEVSNLSPGRIYNMIMSKGTTQIDDSMKTRGYEDLVRYNFFDTIYGDRPAEAIHDIVRFLKAAARRTETGKRILILVGPVSSGKSTIATLLKKGLENDPTPKYAIAGCPFHEEPLHLIPEKDRKYWQDNLGVRIEGFVCPVCRQMLKEKYTDVNGNILWEDVPIEEVKFSEQDRVGIGTFQPSDPKCVKHDTILFCDEGMISFEEIQEKVMANIDEFKEKEIIIYGINGKEKTSHFFNNGFQNIRKIKTNMGFEIECTDVHPLMVIENGEINWKKSKDITTDDYVGIQFGQNIFGNNENMTKELAKLIGYLVSEGSITKTDIWFSNNDDRLLNDYQNCFKNEFGKMPKIYNKKNCKNKNACVSSIEIAKKLTEDYGIKRGSYNKDIPFCVRTSNKECVVSFLEGLFWGDGSISTRGDINSNRFKYGSTSKILVKQVQMVLLNLGIVSSISSSKMKYNDNDFYEVIVYGDHVNKLLEIIPSLKDKKTDDGNFIDNRNSSNWDKIPNLQILFEDCFEYIIKNVGSIYKTTFAKYARYKSYSDKWSRIPRRSTIKSFINEMKDCLDNKSLDSLNSLENIVNSNIIWMKVSDIMDNGYDQVYDLTVPETHSFCANGFINHNSQDISELIGSINISKMTRFGEGDPRSYQFNGELEVSNGGIIEYIEILKADTKFHYVLISAAQEQVIKAPRFPQMYIDTLILGHTNQTEFDTFKSEKKNEALHDRMYKIECPWNLTVDEEIKIYEKLIAQSDFKNIHIAPNTLKIAAEFAILSRLVPSTKVSSLIEKMKIYNGEISQEMKSQNIDVKSLREEGREQGEGMSGVSPRFIINALNVALGMKEDKKCINPIDTIRALRTHFEHQIGISDDEKKRLLNLLLGEKDSASAEFKDIARKEVNKAFLSAYDEQAQSLFENYVMNAEAFCKKEKIRDSITGEFSDPDEKLMRQIEEHIGVPTNSKNEFRQGIFVYKASQLERKKEFTFNDYEPLKLAIEKKLLSDLKNVVSLTIADKAATDKKTIGRRKSAINRLKERGYCDECAQVLLSFVGEILRKEE